MSESQYRKGTDGKYGFSISSPKTAAGVRKVPLSLPVRKALYDWNRQKTTLNISCDVEIDGVSGFVFCSANGTPQTVTKLNFVLSDIVKSYNEENEDALPAISCHTLRHTFCTRQIENGVNPRVLQTVIGHETPLITLQTYTNIENDYACDEIGKIADAEYEGERKYG